MARLSHLERTRRKIVQLTGLVDALTGLGRSVRRCICAWSTVWFIPWAHAHSGVLLHVANALLHLIRR